jgi:multidrug transporter EmrE-like cation transporter
VVGERIRRVEVKPMQTPWISIVYFVVAAVFGAVGQYFYKTGADRAAASWTGYLLNVRLLAGVICYVLVMVLFVAAFRRGGAMSVLYPVYASTFIWGAIIALVTFGEPIRPVNVVGMGLLILSMYLMGLGK